MGARETNDSTIAMGFGIMAIGIGVGFGVDGMKRKSPFSTLAIVISSSWASGQDFGPAFFGCVILRDG